MADLFLGVLIISVISAVAFWGAIRLTVKAPGLLADLLALVTVLIMVLYTRDLWDSMALARWLPFSNLIVVGNWFPVATCFLAGIAWRRIPGQKIRKGFSVCALLAIAGVSVYYPIRGVAPECGDKWDRAVCLQTTRSTCSPASAATLLRAHDIPATEQEMADLCLTRVGTHWQGLYRGLKLKTQGTPWDVEVFSYGKPDLDRLTSGPAILTVQLDRDSDVGSRYENDFGWVPGLSHSAVFLGFRGEQIVEVGDPSIGRELWTIDDLKLLWHGEGMRLVPRQGRGL